MTNKNLLADAVYDMLFMPVFNIHLSMRVSGHRPYYSLYPITTHLGDRNSHDFDDRRRAIANNVASLLTSMGLHITSITPSPATGLLELELNPLMARHPMIVHAFVGNAMARALEDIVSGIAYEIQSGSLKDWDDARWVSALGLSSDKNRINVPLAKGTRLYSKPELYNLHQVKDPSVLALRFGEDFVNAIERVVYINHWDNDVLPEESLALPLERFERLARAHGFDKFFYESPDSLWISKSA